MRRPIIAGNWKLNKTPKESKALSKEILKKVQDVKNVDILVCPVFTSLSVVDQVIKGSVVKLGAQNCYWENSGAFTGEVSPQMIKELGCGYVIIGHSERRAMFSETNETVNKKIKAALTDNLIPILCVGETLSEREAKETLEVIRSHVEGGLNGLDKQQAKNLIIAYEPLWAIGTGKVATPEQAEEVHKFIRELLEKLYDKSISDAVRIQYGGSVKPDNAEELMKKPNIDGALIGGASLKADSFAEIVAITSKLV